MRHSGGSIPAERFKPWRQPVFIAWPMCHGPGQGTVDGLASTTKSVESAKLHESGLKYGYRPGTSTATTSAGEREILEESPPDLQKILQDTWNDLVPNSARSPREQTTAKEFLKSKGVEIYDPSDEELAQWRKVIMANQDAS